VIPVNWNRSGIADRRGFLLFPQSRGESSGESYEDDGQSEAYREGSFWSWRVTIAAESDVLRIAIQRRGRFTGDAQELTLVLPGQEPRPVQLSGARIVDEGCVGGQRCLSVRPAPDSTAG
jgi:alpha-glucosidase